MPKTPGQKGLEDARIMLGLLEQIERDSSQSQRHLAVELGIALGLVNAYLGRCVKKGLLKVGQAPARRYAYYLTPKGFAEKSRLTVEYLSHSFSLFRRAKLDCATILETARAKGINKLALAGVSDVAEIAMICALESRTEIVAIVDPQSSLQQFLRLPVFASFNQICGSCEGVIVTDIVAPRKTYEAAAAQFGKERVFTLAMLSSPVAEAQQVTA